MRTRLECLDRLIADSEQRITEQVLRVLVSEAEGKPTTEAKRLLRNLQAIHVEALKAREAITDGVDTVREAGAT